MDLFGDVSVDCSSDEGPDGESTISQIEERKQFSKRR